MAKGIFVGIVIAIVLGGCLGFGLAYIFPNQPEIPEPDLSGKVLQTECLSIGSNAEIYNYFTTKIEILDTNLTILTNGESYLVIKFTMNVRWALNKGFAGLSRFIISIEVNGVSRTNATIEHFQEPFDPISSTTFCTHPIALECVTPPLASDFHTVNITWFSESSCLADPIYSAASQLNTGGSSTMYGLSNRTLIIQEISL